MLNWQRKMTIKKPTQGSLAKVLPWLLLVGGVIGMVASILLSIEVFNRLKDPGYIPFCNLNPVVSCTSVADSPQGRLFGFPNYFIGIAAYAAIATIGAAQLAGACFKRWFWRAVQLGVAAAMVFITWLQFQSLYRIGALCLFCVVVWAVTGPIFWYVTLYNLREGNLTTPARLKGIAGVAQKYHAEILTSWFLLILILITARFWYYWSTLF